MSHCWQGWLCSFLITMLYKVNRAYPLQYLLGLLHQIFEVFLFCIHWSGLENKPLLVLEFCSSFFLFGSHFITSGTFHFKSSPRFRESPRRVYKFMQRFSEIICHTVQPSQITAGVCKIISEYLKGPRMWWLIRGMWWLIGSAPD